MLKKKVNVDKSKPMTDVLEKMSMVYTSSSQIESKGDAKDISYYLIKNDDSNYVIRRTQTLDSSIQVISEQETSKCFIGKFCPHILHPISYGIKQNIGSELIFEELFDCQPNQVLDFSTYNEGLLTGVDLYQSIRQFAEGLNLLYEFGTILLDISQQTLKYDTNKKIFLFDPSFNSMVFFNQNELLFKQKKSNLEKFASLFTKLNPIYAPPEILELHSKENPKEIALDKINVYMLALFFFGHILKIKNEEINSLLELRNAGKIAYGKFLQFLITKSEDYIKNMKGNNEIETFIFGLLFKCLTYDPSSRLSPKELAKEIMKFETKNGKNDSYLVKFGRIYENIEERFFPFYEISKLDNKGIIISKEEAKCNDEVMAQLNSQIIQQQCELEKNKHECLELVEKVKVLAEKEKKLQDNIQEKNKEIENLQKLVSEICESRDKKPICEPSPCNHNIIPFEVSNKRPELPMPKIELNGKTDKEIAEYVLKTLEQVLSPEINENFMSEIGELGKSLKESKEKLVEFNKFFEEISFLVNKKQEKILELYTDSRNNLKAKIDRLIATFRANYKKQDYNSIIGNLNSASLIAPSWIEYVRTCKSQFAAINKEIERRLHICLETLDYFNSQLNFSPGIFSDFSLTNKLKKNFVHYVQFGNQISLHLLDLNKMETCIRKIGLLADYFGFDSVLVKNIVFIAGGQNKPVSGTTYKTMIAIDISEIKKSDKDTLLVAAYKNDMLSPKYDLTLVKFNAKTLFAIGGRVMIEGKKIFLNGCEKYSIPDDKWTQAASLNEKNVWFLVV